MIYRFALSVTAGSMIGFSMVRIKAEGKVKPQSISLRMESLVKDIQNNVKTALEKIEGGTEGKKFLMDSWLREEG